MPFGLGYSDFLPPLYRTSIVCKITLWLLSTVLILRAGHSRLELNNLVSNWTNLNGVSNNKHCKYNCVVWSSFGQTNQLTLTIPSWVSAAAANEDRSDVSGIVVVELLTRWLALFSLNTMCCPSWVMYCKIQENVKTWFEQIRCGLFSICF